MHMNFAVLVEFSMLTTILHISDGEKGRDDDDMQMENIEMSHLIYDIIIHTQFDSEIPFSTFYQWHKTTRNSIQITSIELD